MIRPSLALVFTLSFLPLVEGCVPKARYDAAVAGRQQEMEARRRIQTDLYRARADLAGLHGELDAKERALTDRDGVLAQQRLDADRVATEREDAAMLVEQLRGELGRAGDHLRQFSEQKKALETALAEAEDKAKQGGAAGEAQTVIVARDVTLAAFAPPSPGDAVVAVVGGKPAVRLDARRAFAENGEDLAPSATAVLERLGAVLAARPGLRVDLADRSEAATPEDRIVRLQKVADVLTSRGLGMERIGLVLPDAQAAAPPAKPGATFRDGPGSIELVVAFEDSIAVATQAPPRATAAVAANPAPAAPPAPAAAASAPLEVEVGD